MRRLIILFLTFSSLTICATASATTCTPTAEMTQGPYYVAGENLRRNIIDKQPGIRTSLTFTIVDSSCKPVRNAQVDVWHANAAGVYSGVNGNSANFLRGSQISNSQGKVTFATIFPGWYPGRVMHIHVKVWRDGKEVLASQLFAKDALVAKIYGKGVYAQRGNQDTTSAEDGIFRSLRNANAQLMTLKIGATIVANARLVLP